MLCYGQLIQLFVYFLLSINLSDGDRTILFKKNKRTINRFQRQVANIGECQIPDNPLNGEYLIGGDDARIFKSGDNVPQYRVLLLKCTNGYKPSPPDVNSSLCMHGLWQPEPRFCSRACRPLSSSKSTNIQCSFDDKPLDTCDDPVEGTIAHFSCEALYEDLSIEFNPTRLCRDGDWNGIPQCFPICGQKHPAGRPNVINGTVAAIGDYPWQVGIYSNKKELRCGGAVISPQVILSAAHCFTLLSDGSPYPKENFLIAVGKHYRNYDDSRDQYSQYPTIDSIHVPPQYKGSKLQYEADIAVIVLANSLTLSEAVQPVCVDWSNLYEHQQLIPDNYGVVTGWGFTREGLYLSEELKELSVPFIPFDQCFENVPTAFQKFLRSDKICGGYLQSSSSTCQGDSGGALVFPRGSNGRFYIRGIVSTSPATTEGQCDSNQYGLYTLLSKHLQFVHSHYHIHNYPSVSHVNRNAITSTPSPVLNSHYHIHNYPSVSHVNRNAITSTPSPVLEEKRCLLPPDPTNGYHYTNATFPHAEAGYVSTDTALITVCNNEHKSVNTHTSKCINGVWVPPLTGCTTMAICEGTGAQIACSTSYELSPSTEKFSSICQNGVWDSELLQCVPSCGKKITKSQPLVGEAVVDYYPWQVGIYTVGKHHICGGVLISSNKLLTAAHCLTSRNGHALPKESYLIAAGKRYRMYDDSRDLNAQYSKVEAIHVPSQYKGAIEQHQGDIAIIVLNNTLVLSDFIQPACLDLNNEFATYNLAPISNAIVTAWGYNASMATPLDELREFRISDLLHNDCIANVSEKFRKLITPDKKCTIYLSDDSSVCFGDSGSPLLIKNPTNERYYVDGLYLDSPGLCHPQYLSYILISKHLEFIKDHFQSNN